jgi:hypothetical protein
MAQANERPLREQVRLEVGTPAAHAGVDRDLGLARDLPRPVDGGLHREAGVAVARDTADLCDVVLAVAAVAARQALRLGEAVARLPHAKRALGDARLAGHLTDAELGAHAG